MEKGLCISCNADKTCVFPRRFPVTDCEEFTDYSDCRHSSKIKPQKACFSSEETQAE